MGQIESSLGKWEGFLNLTDPAAASPDVSTKTWQASAGGADAAWVEAPQLKCTAWTPPPPGLKLEGGSLPGEAAKYPGTYRLVDGKLVNGRPAYQHTSDATLWIAFAGAGWMGQIESELGRFGYLDLTDSAAASPDVSTDTWKAWDDSAWVEAPQLKCTAWTPPPPGLKLEGGSLPGEAAKYIGTYLLDRSKLVNGRPAYQHTSDATLWIAFDGDRWIGCVSALGENTMGHLYLQDSAAASPDVSANTWQASAGGAAAWVEAPQLKCTAWTPPLSAAEKAAAEKAAAEKAAAERAAAEKAAAAAAASTPAVAGSPRSPTAASTSRAPGQSQPGPAHLWMWEDGAVGSGAWQLFDTASEETFRNHEEAGVLHFRIEIRGQAYNVDLSRCTQRNVRTGFVRSLKRHALTDVDKDHVDKDLPSLSQFPGSYGLAPPYWAAHLPAGQLPGAASTQGIGHAPYVLGEILSTERIRSPFFGLGVNIRPIERHVALCDFVRSMMPPQLRSRLLTVSHIRSEARFNLYQAARDALISRIGRAQLNETWLWHGTSRNTLESIMANGFDRNMNERGQYGVGSYFSNQLEYSLREEYAKPDDEESQWVLLVRVLVGQSCVGMKGMRQPDKKPGGGAVLFESMVDSLYKPSIFVLSTGSDNHAYPEFVLRLTR
jgi:hypothetical protein